MPEKRGGGDEAVARELSGTGVSGVVAALFSCAHLKYSLSPVTKRSFIRGCN